MCGRCGGCGYSAGVFVCLFKLEQAQETTERRRQLEAEKELTEDLIEQYELQAEKDKKLLETLTEMNKSFYCELCDRQYTKYSEYENHINSYSHHHQQVRCGPACVSLGLT